MALFSADARTRHCHLGIRVPGSDTAPDPAVVIQHLGSGSVNRPLFLAASATN
jgi:hypothetical protein